jgi:hypothetical protein
LAGCTSQRQAGNYHLGAELVRAGDHRVWNAIREIRPELFKGFNPWDRISDPASVRALLRTENVDQLEVVAEAGTHPIPSPDAWWSAVLGSGLRGTLAQLGADDFERVRMANLNFIRESNIQSVEANVVYAVATKA